MKAKKIVSFCSLFSLVLILSVYYVLSPVSINNDTQPVSSNLANEKEAQISVVDGESAYFDNLYVLKETAFLNEIKELEAIVASASSSKEEKITALELKNTKTKMNENEKQLANLIKENGYSNVYVEYEGKKVNILVSKADSTKTDALAIMRTVYGKIGEGYTPAIMFKA